jgi:hypothetical protein
MVVTTFQHLFGIRMHTTVRRQTLKNVGIFTIPVSFFLSRGFVSRR